MRSYQSHPLFHWIDQQSERLLGRSMHNPGILSTWLVWAQRFGVCFDGGTCLACVSILHLVNHWYLILKFNDLTISPRARGIYYVTTNGKPPYARGFPGKNRRSARGDTPSLLGEYSGVRKWAWMLYHMCSEIVIIIIEANGCDINKCNLIILT